MQIKLEDLDAVKNGVLVDRDGPNEFNGFTWRVTFLDNAQAGGGDFILSPLENSLMTTNGSLITFFATFFNCFIFKSINIVSINNYIFIIHKCIFFN